MSTKQVNIPRLGEITLYKRRGNRSLRLSIGSGGEIRVSMPYWLPYKAGEQFALSNAPWIQAHQVNTHSMLTHGQPIGKAHRLYFDKHPLATKVESRVVNQEIRIRIPDHSTTDAANIQAIARSASIRALRRESESLLPQRLRMLSDKTGLSYKSMVVKHLKRRWGSCNSDKEITLNLFLMQLPWHLIDYVIIHELTHTKVMRHGAPFWRELEGYLPLARNLRKEIAQYQPILSPK